MSYKKVHKEEYENIRRLAERGLNKALRDKHSSYVDLFVAILDTHKRSANYK